MKRELVVLVADADAEAVVGTLLSKRHKSLGIKPMMEGKDFVIHKHPNRDSGVRTGAVDFLRPFQRDFRRALVIFDHKGCGAEGKNPQDLEHKLEQELKRNGWRDRCAVIVIEPELEAWVWASLHHIARVAGLTIEDLQGILAKYPKNNLGKPVEPKEAWREVLRRGGRKPSAKIFGELAEGVSLSKCQDRAFRKLVAVLRSWFPS
ncbi:methylation-associated defense system protein MAD4 [Fervidibacter sacchari]